jgi:putative transposase
MPRKPRNFQKGGIYHITQRGVDKRNIFLDKRDYSRFILALEFFNSSDEISLWEFFFSKERGCAGSDPAQLKKLIYEKRIKQNKKGRVVDFLAFALMPNHYHLLLREIEEGGISYYMQKMGGYVIYFNNRYQREGSLFQSRYHSVTVENETQLKITFNYIHTNPVEIWEPGWKNAKIKEPKKALNRLYRYRYSSLLDYIGKYNVPSVTNRGFFLEIFGGKEKIKEETKEWIEEKSSLGDDFCPQAFYYEREKRERDVYFNDKKKKIKNEGEFSVA